MPGPEESAGRDRASAYPVERAPPRSATRVPARAGAPRSRTGRPAPAARGSPISFSRLSTAARPSAVRTALARGHPVEGGERMVGPVRIVLALDLLEDLVRGRAARMRIQGRETERPRTSGPRARGPGDGCRLRTPPGCAREARRLARASWSAHGASCRRAARRRCTCVGAHPAAPRRAGRRRRPDRRRPPQAVPPLPPRQVPLPRPVSRRTRSGSDPS